MKIISRVIIVFFSITNLFCTPQSQKENNSSAVKSNTIKIIQENSLKVIELETGTKYKFKGMAIDSNEEYGYFGSWNQKVIVKINLITKKLKILETPYNGKLNGMGVTIKNGKLYALMNEINDEIDANALSVLLVIDLKSDRVIRTYEIKGNSDGRHHFNHVIIDKKGIAYISNTLQSSIYTVNTEDSNDKIRLLIESPQLSMIHGLDLSSNESKIFCTSYSSGIKIIDLKNRLILPYSNSEENRNDGLIFENGFLYGVGENIIKRYTLNQKESSIINTEVILIDHPKFNDPRCLQIIGEHLYCLANINIDPVKFRRNNDNSRKTPLKDSHIIKIGLKSVLNTR